MNKQKSTLLWIVALLIVAVFLWWFGGLLWNALLAMHGKH